MSARTSAAFSLHRCGHAPHVRRHRHAPRSPKPAICRDPAAGNRDLSRYWPPLLGVHAATCLLVPQARALKSRGFRLSKRFKKFAVIPNYATCRARRERRRATISKSRLSADPGRTGLNADHHHPRRLFESPRPLELSRSGLAPKHQATPATRPIIVHGQAGPAAARTFDADA